MPEEHTDRSGPDALRVGPWLGEDVPESAVEAAKTGPSWTAPTIELRPAIEVRPAIASRTGRTGTGPTPITGPHGKRSQAANPDRTDEQRQTATRDQTATRGRADHRPRRWPLREYTWLIASGGLALIVLLGTRFLLPGPAPDWLTITATGTHPGTAPTASRPPATSAAPHTTPPTSRPSATATARPTPKATSRTPRRTPAAPTIRATRPVSAPVLLGPGGDGELWSMLNRYCAEVHDIRLAQLRYGRSPAENNWECRRRSRSILIDMTAACRHIYVSTAYARYGNPDDAFSWRCYRRP